MKPIKIAFVAYTLILSALWLVSAAGALSLSDTHALAAAFTQVSGILSIAMMAFANVLAIRLRLLEPLLNGLDKMYRLHKWLGIGGLAIGIVHWLTATGDGRRPDFQTDATSTASDAATATAAAQTSTITDGLSSLQGPAHGIAQPALFLLIALIALALIKAVPYRWFAKTHILTVAVFLALGFHSVVLMKAAYWSTAIGWITALLIALGTIAAIISLAHYAGLSRRARAKVLSATYYPELHVVETELLVNSAWSGHKPGQFAFVTTDWSEGAHPFTIATAWSPKDQRIGFIAKELGDHTAKLREHFEKGRRVFLEGPYGNFTFDDDKPRQIWVGGGIGISPFVAKMRELGLAPGTKPIDLFHATTDVSEAALAKMRSDAERAGIRLHILVSSRDGRLDAETIMKRVPEWKTASVWFCGPTAFGAALYQDFSRAGLASQDFHEELFSMR